MIKFLDLQAANAAYSTEIEEAILRATRSGWYLRGEETRHFEEAYAQYIGCRHAIACGNGLDIEGLTDHTRGGDHNVVCVNAKLLGKRFGKTYKRRL